MTTISIDGPKAMHEEMRGLPGSWDRGIETFRRLRGIKRSNFQTVVGMTLMEKNAAQGRRDHRGDPAGHPRFQAHRAAPEHRARVGPLLRQPRPRPVEPSHARSSRAVERPSPRRTARACTRSSSSRIATRRSSRSTTRPGKSPLPCTALSSSCFIDAYWNLYRVLDLGREDRQPPRERIRSAGDVGRRPPPRAARGRRRRALLALLDAVRGVSDDSREPVQGDDVSGAENASPVRRKAR